MPDPAPTVTIPGVELLKVGTWAASTGPVTVTEQHLADMVAAAGDPEVDKAPLKLGHTGALSNLGDSAPGLGWATNLHVAEDGQTLLGDLTDIPAALEAPIKAGFKNRSAEIAWGVKTAAGKVYSAVIDGLALLGVQAPAVKGLADLAALYTPAALSSAGLEAESHSWLALYDAPMAIDEPSTEERIANSLRWAKTAAAELAAVAGIKGLDAVFAALDAMAVPDSRGLLAGTPHHDPVTPATPGGTMPTKFKPEELATARTKLGMADDTTDEQVIAKLSELDELVTGMKVPEPEPKHDPEPEPAALSAETIAALKDAGLTVVTDAAFEQLQANATAGATAHSLLAAQSRDRVLDEAQAAGKFGAGDASKETRTKFSALLDSDFEQAKAVIDVLPAIVPVTEIGSDAGTGPGHTDLSAASEAAIDAGLREIFGDEIPTPAKEA